MFKISLSLNNKLLTSENLILFGFLVLYFPAITESEDSKDLDEAVFNIWENVCKYRPGYDFETLENVLKDFDLMIKFANLWAFS